jgi:Ca2+-binding RTX toxin-like protein
MADPGNTLDTAQVQSSSVFTLAEQVSQADSSDIYRFQVDQPGIFTANLSQLTGDADVRLILDRNANGAIEPFYAFVNTNSDTDQLQNIENVIGSAFNDRIIGDRNINIIYTGNGDDRVEARDGNDTIFGETGNDTLLGEGDDDLLIGDIGADLLDGGVGNDTASYSTSALDVIANLSTGRGATGDARGDVYELIENLEGSQLGDHLIGEITTPSAG